MIDDRKLLADVRRHIKANPDRATAFLNVVAEGLDDFAKAARRYQNSLARSAIHLSMSRKPTSVPKSIDAAMFRWPLGPPDRELMSACEAKWWDRFYEIAVEYDASQGRENVDEWLKCRPCADRWWAENIRGDA